MTFTEGPLGITIPKPSVMHKLSEHEFTGSRSH
jgi:hypothetical protein